MWFARSGSVTVQNNDTTAVAIKIVFRLNLCATIIGVNKNRILAYIPFVKIELTCSTKFIVLHQIENWKDLVTGL